MSALLAPHGDAPASSFPLSAGVLLGLGLGGFFDGIVLHQLLQWHHMLTSAGYPADSVRNLRINTLWDGVFHSATYVFVGAGLVVLWRAAHRCHLRWSTRLLVGTLLIGFRRLQRRRRARRPPRVAAAPCQRDRAARAVDLLGPRLPRLGRGDVDRRLAVRSQRSAANRTARRSGSALTLGRGACHAPRGEDDRHG